MAILIIRSRLILYVLEILQFSVEITAVAQKTKLTGLKQIGLISPLQTNLVRCLWYTISRHVKVPNTKHPGMSPIDYFCLNRGINRQINYSDFCDCCTEGLLEAKRERYKMIKLDMIKANCMKPFRKIWSKIKTLNVQQFEVGLEKGLQTILDQMVNELILNSGYCS